MDVFGAAKFMTNRGPEIEKILRKLKRSKAAKAAPRSMCFSWAFGRVIRIEINGII